MSTANHLLNQHKCEVLSCKFVSNQIYNITCKHIIPKSPFNGSRKFMDSQIFWSSCRKPHSHEWTANKPINQSDICGCMAWLSICDSSAPCLCSQSIVISLFAQQQSWTDPGPYRELTFKRCHQNHVGRVNLHLDHGKDHLAEWIYKHQCPIPTSNVVMSQVVEDGGWLGHQLVPLV
jgi:hypothetical protein